MAKTIRAYVLEPTYAVDRGCEQAVVHLWCRLEDGRAALVKKPFIPYFFVRAKDEKEAEKSAGAIKASFERTGLKTMGGEPVVKVSTPYPQDVPKLRDAFERRGLACYEADIRFAYRAMMDWGVHGTFSLLGEEQEPGRGINVDVVFDDPVIRPVDEPYTPSLSVLSFDVESDKDSDDLFCISCYGKDQRGEVFQEKLIVSEEPVRGAKHFKDEKSLLESFVAYVNEANPDVITGWNVIDFDLDYLHRRMKQHEVRCGVGRDGSELKLRIQSSFFRDSSADARGRIILDGMQLLRNSFVRLKDYKLDTAAKEFAKEEKLIQSTGQEKYAEIRRLYDEDKQALLKYNLLDAKLAYDVVMNSGSFPLAVKRSLLVGMPLDRVNASIASLDSLYLRELRSRGYVAPVVGGRARDDEGIGGYVMNPKPGIYDYVIVCDFKSLYPSLMRTFNIDPLMYVPDEEAKKEKNLIEAPNGAHFRRELGIVPGLIERFWKEREEARKRGDELARYAIKIHMNSIYGVLASPNCRFFNRQVGNAITGFAKHFIQLTAKHVKDKGYEVIYGDTDSVFINLACDSYDVAQRLGKSIEEGMNEYLKGYVEKTYGLPSFLELEFEKTFIRFVLPRVRGADKGAKKRYAGLVKKDGREDVSFTGLEMVRRDWTDLAKEFQRELYRRVFKKEEVAGYVREVIKDLHAGKFDKKLVYRKALRKDVSEYTKTTPPHVKAAMKLDRIESELIEYVMTEDGPEPVQKLEHDIDYDHYIEKQLKPIADSLLGFYGTSFDEQLTGSSQSSLADF
ncbi:DNA polymerase II [Candidatus Woesearchaeota archaeon]|nr:DNA polymerase II [Candidatus Woesearchaeota archaeon]